MADTKITEMVAGSMSASDLLTFVSDPSGTPANKKIALSAFETGLTVTESQISDLGAYATVSYVDSAIAGLTALESEDIDTLAEINAIISDATLISSTATDASGYGWVIDEDDMLSDSATKVPTQQSVKAYVDAEVAGAGSSLPVVDTTGIAKGSVDTTKVVRLEVDGLTASTTRVLTVQDADGTIALTGDNIAASQVTSGTLAHERGGLEADVSAYAGVPLIDSGSTSELKYNLTATTTPGVGDDSADGYTVGSRWVNVTLDKEFVCLDASTGAAVWTETTAGADSGTGSTATNSPAALFSDAKFTVPHVGGFSIAGQSLPSGKILFLPVWVPADVTLTKIGFQTATNYAGETAVVGLYSDNGGPDALLVQSGEVALDTAGFFEETISKVVEAGWYWLAVMASATVSISGIPSANLTRELGISWSGATITGQTHYKLSETYAATMPNPATSGTKTIDGGGCPAIFVG